MLTAEEADWVRETERGQVPVMGKIKMSGGNKMEEDSVLRLML